MKISMKKLNIIMAYKCLSAGEVSRLSGVSNITLSKIKRNCNIRPQTVGKIAKALDVKIEDLIEL